MEFLAISYYNFNMNFKQFGGRFHRQVIAFIGGALYAWGFPSVIAESLFISTTIGFIALEYGLSWEAKEITLKKRFLTLFSFCFAYYLFGYYWIPNTISEFGAVPFPLNHLIGAFFPFFICPHLVAYLVVRNKLSQKLSALPNSSRILIYALILTLFEYFIPQQFPAHIGHPWLILAPYLYLAKIFGAPLFSFLNFWIALTFTDFSNSRKLSLFPILILAFVCLINFSLPINFPEKNESLTPLNIRIVQANIGNFDKIQAEKGVYQVMKDVINYYRNESIKDSPVNLDLIIWPETAYPNHLSSKRAKKDPKALPANLRDIPFSTDSEFLFGGYDYVGKPNKYFFENTANTVFLMGKSGELKDTYHKIKLIPFGETLPFGPLNSFLSKHIQNVSYFARGSRFNLLKLDNDLKIATPICYEILFSQFILNFFKNGKSPDLFVNLTNDSWYGAFPEPYQHKFLASWRALEFGIPIIRSTNTGITSVIYPDGSESPQLKWGEKTSLDLQLKIPKNKPLTLFATLGIFAFTFFFLFVFILDYFWQRSRPEINREA